MNECFPLSLLTVYVLIAISDLLTNQVLTYGTPLLSSTVDEFQALENDPEYQKMTQQVHWHIMKSS